MEEFIKQNYFVLTHGIELLATTTGLFLFKKHRNTDAKYFILFLVYLTVCDTLCGYTTYVYKGRFLDFLIGTIFEKNHWWSTLFWNIGAIMFFAFYYGKILKTKIFRDIIKYSSSAFLIFCFVYIVIHLDAFFYHFFPIISVLGAVIIFLCSVLYFVEILQSDKILTFYKSLNFYISLAIFIWWLIITPIVFYNIYYTYDLKHSYNDWNFVFLRWQIYLFANIFMYSTFTFALIWCRPEKK